MRALYLHTLSGAKRASGSRRPAGRLSQGFHHTHTQVENADGKEMCRIDQKKFSDKLEVNVDGDKVSGHTRARFPRIEADSPLAFPLTFLSVDSLGRSKKSAGVRRRRERVCQQA